MGPTRRGKGSKILAISDGHGLPVAVHVASASPHETKLVKGALAQRFVEDIELQSVSLETSLALPKDVN